MAVSKSRNTLTAALGGQVLDYAQITSPVNVTTVDGVGVTDIITGNAVAYDGSTAIQIEVYLKDIQLPNIAASNYVAVLLYDGATSLGYGGILLGPNSTLARASTSFSRRLTPTAGTHTYSVKAVVGATGTGVINCGAGGAGEALPAFIRITRESSLIGGTGIGGVQGGFAPLDSNLLIPASYLPRYVDYTPILTAATSNPTLGSGSASVARYVQFGKLVHYMGSISFGSSGVDPGSGEYRISLPLTATSGNWAYGSAILYDDSGAAFNIAHTFFQSTTNCRIAVAGTGLIVSHASPWTWAANDNIRFSLTYEAA